MQAQQDSNSGERLTFLDFFEKKKYQIEIPIIQRDYAQGRASSGEIREVFLDTLYTYLEENKPNRDLDFVYGSIVKDENNNKRFIPLDGQQRLTTLFLLHWYLAHISGNSRQFRAAITEKDQSKFSYETRTSSREFCDALVINDIDMDHLLPADPGAGNQLSKTIRDSGWYYLSWENDPTIQSMMTMLDAMRRKFNGKPEFYAALTDDNNPVITFLSLDLKEFKLTDDLYIKMNSRGKPLTPFENFKAKFEQHIGKLDWQSNSTHTISYDHREKTVSRQDYFSHQVDTAWADLFWNYRNKKAEYSSFDKELMNFIRVVVSSRFALEKSANQDETLEYLLGTQVVSRRKDYTDNISFHRYQGFKVLTSAVVTFLISAFDHLANGSHKIKIHLQDQDFYDEEDVFKKVLEHSLSLEQRVQFYAYISFLIRHEGKTDGLAQWMRVIHNLTLNTIIDSADDVARAIISVETLLIGSKDILTHFISTKAVDIDFFYRRQVQEEQLKAHLISRSPVWVTAIENAEKHTYFLGQIMFIFEFSGILAFYEKDNHCDWEPDEDIQFFKKFQSYAAKAGAVFDTIGTLLNKDFAWERAVLTKGDYLVYASQWRRNFLSSNRFHRDYSWKRLLRLPSNFGTNLDEGLWLEKQRSYVKAVFDDPLFDVTDLKNSLKEICRNKPNDWRRYFISRPALIGYCGQGFIRFESSAKIFLFKHSQQNHYQAELYTYNFFLKEIWQKELNYPFEHWYYHEVRTGDEQPCIKFEDYKFKAKTYRMDILYETLIDEFEIVFSKTKGIKTIDNYDEGIIEILESLAFEWLEQEQHFSLLAKNEKEIINKITELCGQLNDLKQH